MHQHMPGCHQDNDIDLNMLGEWDSFGENALVEDENACRIASCTTVSPVEALVLSGHVLKGMMRDERVASSALAAAASRRIHLLSEQNEARRKAAKSEL